MTKGLNERACGVCGLSGPDLPLPFAGNTCSNECARFYFLALVLRSWDDAQTATQVTINAAILEE